MAFVPDAFCQLLILMANRKFVCQSTKSLFKKKINYSGQRYQLKKCWQIATEGLASKK